MAHNNERYSKAIDVERKKTGAILAERLLKDKDIEEKIRLIDENDSKMHKALSEMLDENARKVRSRTLKIKKLNGGLSPEEIKELFDLGDI